MTKHLEADARDPHAVLEQAGHILDFDRPVALPLDWRPESAVDETPDGGGRCRCTPGVKH